MIYRIEYNWDYLCDAEITENSDGAIDEFFEFRGSPDGLSKLNFFLHELAAFVFYKRDRPYGKGEKADWDEGWPALDGSQGIKVYSLSPPEFDETLVKISKY